MLHSMVLLSCCLCLLKLGDALNCTVTVEYGRTTYIISDLPQDSAGGWSYTWANSTDHVIANNQQAIPGLVLKNTNTTLHTSEFIQGIVFTGFMISTGDRYTAHCQNTSTGNAHSWKNTEISGYTFPTAAVFVFVAVCILLLVVLLPVLLYKFRDKIPRCSSGSSPGCMYTTVKTADAGVWSVVTV